MKKPARKWEQRWVYQPNAIEFGQDIWILKWVCVDSRIPSIGAGEDALNEEQQQLLAQ